MLQWGPWVFGPDLSLWDPGLCPLLFLGLSLLRNEMEGIC